MKGGTEQRNSETENLLPHQLQLVEDIGVLSERVPLVLCTDPGFGAAAAIVSAIDILFKKNPDSRTLIISRASVRMLWLDFLQKKSIDSMIFDRYAFRESLNFEEEKGFFSVGKSFVASHEFLRQTDIFESCISVEWDLIVVDEADVFIRARNDLISNFASVAKKFIMNSSINMINIIFDLQLDALKYAKIVVWNREDLTDNAGRKIGLPKKEKLKHSRFKQNTEEENVSVAVSSLLELMIKSDRRKNLNEINLVRSCLSSPVALEKCVRRISSGKSFEIDQTDNSSQDPDDPSFSLFSDEKNIPEIGEAARVVISAIELIKKDTKIEVFLSLLQEIKNINGSARVCVLVDFVSTLNYLTTEIVDREVDFVLLHGGMTVEARNDSIGKFLTDCSLLFCTSGVINGEIQIPSITDLVFYDPPFSRSTFEKFVARFNQLGAKGPLVVHTLLPQESQNLNTFFAPEFLDKLYI